MWTTVRAYGASGWSTQRAPDTRAGHRYGAEEFLTLNKLGNRKLLKVSQRNISVRAAHWLDQYHSGGWDRAKVTRTKTRREVVAIA